ncbi:MAG: phosphotransferase [Gammaproteobacteria bacterium]|nr:phosphotransferase [Gammaproteobacteria bacterium]
MNKPLSNTVDRRHLQLQHWAAKALQSYGAPPEVAAIDAGAISGCFKLVPLCGDAGFRRYFRSLTEPSMIAVDAPPGKTNCGRFVRLADYLRRHGLCTPRVFGADIEQGFLLQEDLGDKLLLGQVNSSNAQALYTLVLNQLLRLQQVPSAEGLFPAYDRAFLLREMRLLPEWLAESLLAYQLNTADSQLLEHTFTLLLDCAEKQPQVLVHRDFHSRNLMLRDGEQPALIDFQDAVWGPITYDLVSLLRDCYIRWPRAQVERWALNYATRAKAAGILPTVKSQTFLRWFDWMGLQRHLKVLGLFPRLCLRDGKQHYLFHLPLVIRYILEVADNYKELMPFADWFRGTLLPLIERQAWYRDYRCAEGWPQDEVGGRVVL